MLSSEQRMSLFPHLQVRRSDSVGADKMCCLGTPLSTLSPCLALVYARISLAAYVMGHGSHLHKACLEWFGNCRGRSSNPS